MIFLANIQSPMSENVEIHTHMCNITHNMLTVSTAYNKLEHNFFDK